MTMKFCKHGHQEATCPHCKDKENSDKVEKCQHGYFVAMSPHCGWEGGRQEALDSLWTGKTICPKHSIQVYISAKVGEVISLSCGCDYLLQKPYGMKLLSNKNKAKMLFVDDRTKRIHYALENFSDNFEVTIATCIPEALRQMSAQDWDVISLDHDLNGYDFQDPDTPTCGMEIVRYIAKTGWPLQRKKPEFWIHSSNLFAAHLMTVSLTEIGLDAWYKPIIYNVEHMEYDEKGIALP